MQEKPRWSGTQAVNQTGHVWGNGGSYQQAESAFWKWVTGSESEQAGGLRLSPGPLFCELVCLTWALPAVDERTRNYFNLTISSQARVCNFVCTW